MPAPDPSHFLVECDPGFDRLSRYEREEDELREVMRARHFVPVATPRNLGRMSAIQVLFVIGVTALLQLAGQS